MRAGGERDANALGALFACLSFTCKFLCRHLVGQLPSLLAASAGLRYSGQDHVRALAAESFGYLLRQAPDKALRQGLRALLAEQVGGFQSAESILSVSTIPVFILTPPPCTPRAQAVKPSERRTHGAGLLVAESVLGVSNSLHSRAPAVVRLLLKQDLLQPEDFAGKGGPGGKQGGQGSGLHSAFMLGGKA